MAIISALLVTLCISIVYAGPHCYHCNGYRGDEAGCNNQLANNIVHCGNGKACSTDVKCDGQNRTTWWKGCKSKKTIKNAGDNYNEVICKNDRHCYYHCKDNECNVDVPWNMPMKLSCTPPEVGLVCQKCNHARGDEDACNTQWQGGAHGATVQCGLKEVCTTDVRCDGNGEFSWIKGCEKVSGITEMDTLICDDPDNQRCRYHCQGENKCNEFAPAEVYTSLDCA